MYHEHRRIHVPNVEMLTCLEFVCALEIIFLALQSKAKMHRALRQLVSADTHKILLRPSGVSLQTPTSSYTVLNYLFCYSFKKRKSIYNLDSIPVFDIP